MRQEESQKRTLLFRNKRDNGEKTGWSKKGKREQSGDNKCREWLQEQQEESDHLKISLWKENGRNEFKGFRSTEGERNRTLRGALENKSSPMKEYN